jgi:hypothetical protein
LRSALATELAATDEILPYSAISILPTVRLFGVERSRHKEQLNLVARPHLARFDHAFWRPAPFPLPQAGTLNYKNQKDNPLFSLKQRSREFRLPNDAQ